MSRLSIYAHRLLAVLTDAAAKGAPCPTNFDISHQFGRESMSAAVPWFKELEQAGLIRVQRFHRSRIVTIVETGASTQEPRHMKKHWRDQSPDERQKAKDAATVAESQPSESWGRARMPQIRLHFQPFTRLEANIFDDALAAGDNIEVAALRAGRSRLDGYRQFHRVCEQLGVPAREAAE